MTLIHGLPEALMDEVRDITFDDVSDAEAAEAADLWMRTRGPYVKGERSGLLKGLVLALTDVLELRGLIPTEDDLAKIAAAKDPAMVDRWRVRAKHVASVADLFAD